ncbi:hypothetical protein K6119_01200 [Paracrocinitomix mangrovi]|uniref:hypothetical protein n=1 Tax=Paracrocinitomix mangrovi TaxID=2862509 RepID=UPI001C8D020F|nr:hypothetical protein [Paracrocinitomix mangrovi]UKN02132.1 hypothetical protein K6119_01200 [Paracrocinitomix mangrovi]
MKHKLLLLPALFLSLLVVSCGSTKRATDRTIDRSESSVRQKTLIGEFKVDLTKKIKGTSVVKNGSMEDAKNLAKWDAIEKSGAHAIVDPIFDFDISGRTISCNVSGYFAKFDKIETATEQDLLNYIRVSLLTGTGILNVSYSQFAAFYRTFAAEQGIAEEDMMSEYELRNYYDEQVRIASANKVTKSFEKSSDDIIVEQPQKKGKGALGVILLLLLITPLIALAFI